MPTRVELLNAGRQDICSAIRRHGGWKVLSHALDWKATSIAKPRSLYLTFTTKKPVGERMRPYAYWRDFENVKQELQDYLQLRRNYIEGNAKDGEHLSDSNARGKSKKEKRMGEQAWKLELFPTAKELRDNGRAGLARAIHLHGGVERVASKLGMRAKYRTKTYWQNFDNVKSELERIIQKAESDNGGLPDDVVLKKEGSQGLLKAIELHGGRETVAKRLGLT